MADRPGATTRKFEACLPGGAAEASTITGSVAAVGGLPRVERHDRARVDDDASR